MESIEGQSVRRRLAAARRRPRFRRRLRAGPEYWNPSRSASSRTGLERGARRGGRSSMSTSVKPYGDTMNDGKVQLSFTLPVEVGGRRTKRRGSSSPKWASKTCKWPRAAGSQAVFRSSSCTPARRRRSISRDQSAVCQDPRDVDGRGRRVRERALGRKVRVAGACIGTDAHTSASTRSST